MTRSTCVDCGAPLTSFVLRCRKCSGGAPAAAPPPPAGPVVHRDVKPANIMAPKAPTPKPVPAPPSRPDVTCPCGVVVKQTPGVRSRFFCSKPCRVRATNARYRATHQRTPAHPKAKAIANAATPQLLAYARAAIAWGRAVLEAHGETP